MDMTLNLEQLAVDLDNAARVARDRMKQNDRRTLTTFSDPVQHRRWLHALLKEMATVINQTAPSNGVGPSRSLYLWPGYDSIVLDGARVTFEVGRGVRSDLAHYGYPSGLSAGGDDRVMQTGALFPPSQKERADRATLYFDAALAGTVVGRNTTTFSVGSTHNWLALGPSVQGDALLGLEVRTRAGSPSTHRSFPVITLDESRPLYWGDDLAKDINTICGDAPESFWPLPVRRPGEAHSVYRERLQAEHRDARHRSIRQRLYSLWLIGCFAEKPGEILLDRTGKVWLDRLISELDIVDPERAARVRGLRELEQNIASRASLDINPARFTTWSIVTIPYAIADTRLGDDGDEPDDLGSGMILSNFDLPALYYLLVRQWIAAYYLSLRQQESSVIRAEREAHKAALQAERELRKQLSHAVGTELTFVSFLATLAARLVAVDELKPSSSVLKAGAEAVKRGESVKTVDFALRNGAPKPIEEQLIMALTRGDQADNSLDRDVSLMEAALAAVVSEEADRALTALATEVMRLSIENRALVRVDEPSVVAVIERQSRVSTEWDESYLSDILAHSMTVAMTVFFRKAFPSGRERGEEVCLESAKAFFKSDNDRTVAEVGQDCANEWRSFVDRQLRAGHRPRLGDVDDWLREVLGESSYLRFELPPPDDTTRFARASGEYAPLVVQAWLTEAMLNSLKYCRRPLNGGPTLIAVNWQSPGAILEVRNTTTEECGARVCAGVEADARGSISLTKGHQGLAFLAYAARHVFKEQRLHSAFDRESSVVRLFVN